MTITKNIAEKIDFILKQALESNDIIVDVSSENWDYNDVETIGEKMESLGIGKLLSESEFQVYSEGISFIKDSSLTEEYNEKIREKEREERKDALTKKQIDAAKREPYLIVYGIITTLTSLFLAYLQFIK